MTSNEQLNAWHSLARETPYRVNVPVIDPHIHLFPPRPANYKSENFVAPPPPPPPEVGGRAVAVHTKLTQFGRPPVTFSLEDYRNDFKDQVNVVACLHVEAGTNYDKHEDETKKHLNPVGETRALAKQALAYPFLRGAVVKVDLRCQPTQIEECLRAHVAAAAEHLPHLSQFVRGVRFNLANHATMLCAAPPGTHREIVGAVRALGEVHGLSLDVWVYRHQIREVVTLAKACPGTTIVFDHLGSPAMRGGEQEMAAWEEEIAELARDAPNAVVKFGGVCMTFMGLVREEARGERSWGSEELARELLPWFRAVIRHFGPYRVVMESNFPMDKSNVSFANWWNAAKKLAFRVLASPLERRAVLFGNANRVYRLGLTLPELANYESAGSEADAESDANASRLGKWEEGGGGSNL